MHECDLIEDLAISFGYNNLEAWLSVWPIVTGSRYPKQVGSTSREGENEGVPGAHRGGRMPQDVRHASRHVARP